MEGARDIYQQRRRLQGLAKATTPTKLHYRIMIDQLCLSSGTHALRLTMTINEMLERTGRGGGAIDRTMNEVDVCVDLFCGPFVDIVS